MTDNELVAPVKDDGKVLAGAGIFDTAEDIGRNVFATRSDDDSGRAKEIDEIAAAIDGIAMSLGVVGVIADPLGSLASSAVGWIIENVSWIRKPFDDLAGDPPAVEAVANTWKNISERLAQVAGQYQENRTEVVDWRGTSAASYGEHASKLGGQLTNASESAKDASSAIKLAGAAVAATRALIRDVLAELAGTLITWGIPAPASAVPTAGASIAAFVTRAVTKAIEIGGRIAQFLKKLFTIMDTLSALAKRMGGSMRGRADELADMARVSPNTPVGNQRAADLMHASTTRASRADSLDGAGDTLAGGAQRGRDAMDNVTNKADALADNWNRRASDWADRVKQNGPNRRQKVQDVYDKLGSPSMNTRSADMPDSRWAWLTKADNATGNGILSGQNWVRAARTFDLGHLMPAWGDVISPIREGLKELNKAFLAEDYEKAKEHHRNRGDQVFLPYRNREEKR
ncbi:hypothetical protein GCM10022243_15240 [Saccharothrix violaceirubra]|uniref:Uncharacterized protein YukE n=1 Tax=Saccharothrix violaceirubra TaxID=413306 RepID=A0A7W7WXH6_9PSEU|nr:hypothetical protein [Saccharothrix violaceirubra]MBB4967400.1 uncharacterized protein YukE [Saccharothrix violaceirubra]